MEIVAAGHTDVGETRELNEDAFLIDEDLRLFIVADGNGGPGRGDIAATMTCDIIAAELRSLHGSLERDGVPESFRRDRLMAGVRRAIDRAGRAVFNEGFVHPERRGLSTTAVVCQLVGASAIVGHVGDSRVYLVRGDTVYRLTDDHTVHAELVDRGLLSPEEAKDFAHKHVLSRSVGSKPAVDVDLMVLDVEDGDHFVLCSDGLSRAIPGDAMGAVTVEHAPDDAAARLVALANEEGGDDNVTVVVVEVQHVVRTRDSIRLEKKVAHLQEVFLFADLDFQEVLRVLEFVREVWVDQGKAIVTEGETGDAFFVIAMGSAIVSRKGKQLTRLEEGAHFGELALLGSGTRTATVTAETDVVLLSIDDDGLRELLWRELRIANKLLWRFLTNLGERVTSLSDDLAT